jgi:pyruvate,water dikinase
VHDSSGPGAATVPLILPLREAAGADRSAVGGKAANLGHLLRAGLPVPDGFVVTTAAFHAHLDDPVICDRRQVLARCGPEDPDAARRLRAAIARRELPPRVRDAVVEGVASHGDGSGSGAAPPPDAWAVRSSAVAEDREEASFAGQYDSFLDVRGEAAVLDRVRACMASLFTDRATAYRDRSGIPSGDVAMAVVVQRMVPADAGGVLFTADPVSGNRRVAVVEAALGSAAAVVGGETDPDHARIDRRTGEVLSYERHSDPGAGGGSRAGPAGASQSSRAEGRKRPVLDDRRLEELVETGREIEELFGGRPQDVEWCLAEGRLHVLQSRPVTALPPVPEPPPSEDRLHVYVNMGPMQSVSEPMPPLVRDLWTNLIQEAVELAGLRTLADRWCAEAAGRVFLDLTPLLGIRPLRRRMASRLGDVSEPTADGLRSLLTRRPEEFVGRGGGLRALWAAMRAGGATVVGQLPRLGTAFLGAFRGEPPELDEEQRFFEAFGRRAADRIRAPPDPSERARRALHPVEHMAEARDLFPRLVGLSAAFLAADWLERLFPDAPGDVDAAGGGFPREIVTRMNQGLGDLADVARRHPEVARALRDGRLLEEVVGVEGGDAFREALGSYLDEFGHRATGEIDLSNPRWREDPSSLLQVVRANLAGAEAGAHREHLEELVRVGEDAARRLVERAGRGPLGFVKRPLVRRLVRTYRGYLPLRELPKQGGAHLFAASREVLLAAGGRLVEDGELPRVEDVWFLREDELLAALEGSAPVEADLAARRAEHERHRAVDAPVLVTSEGEDPTARIGSGGLPDGALGGTGVSSGVAVGSARVVRDPATSSVKPGEILVAPSCGPGWTPLYLNAAALVCEVGGRISHGALVAREYGLPAVVSVRGATREIRTGQRLRVDGSRGVVEVLDEGGAEPVGAAVRGRL